MQSLDDRFLSFVAAQRSRHLSRLRFGCLMCALILALLLLTQWLVLRPGLIILLAGQAGVVLALSFRVNRLSKCLDQRDVGNLQKDFIAAWFKGEQSFVRLVAAFESLCQIIGFVALGYGFGIATGSLWFALAIGIIYPATMYFGVTRGRRTKALRRLEAEKQEIEGRS